MREPVRQRLALHHLAQQRVLPGLDRERAAGEADADQLPHLLDGHTHREEPLLVDTAANLPNVWLAIRFCDEPTPESASSPGRKSPVAELTSWTCACCGLSWSSPRSVTSAALPSASI